MLARKKKKKKGTIKQKWPLVEDGGESELSAPKGKDKSKVDLLRSVNAQLFNRRKSKNWTYQSQKPFCFFAVNLLKWRMSTLPSRLWWDIDTARYPPGKP